MKTYELSPMNEAEGELIAAIECAITNFRVTTGKTVTQIKLVKEDVYGTAIVIRATCSEVAS